MTTPHLLNRKDAAAYIGLATGTLDRWRTERHGPSYIKVGGAVRYKISDLEEWLNSNRVALTG